MKYTGIQMNQQKLNKKKNNWKNLTGFRIQTTEVLQKRNAREKTINHHGVIKTLRTIKFFVNLTDSQYKFTV